MEKEYATKSEAERQPFKLLHDVEKGRYDTAPSAVEIRPTGDCFLSLEEIMLLLDKNLDRLGKQDADNETKAARTAFLAARRRCTQWTADESTIPRSFAPDGQNRKSPRETYIFHRLFTGQKRVRDLVVKRFRVCVHCSVSYIV